MGWLSFLFKHPSQPASTPKQPDRATEPMEAAPIPAPCLKAEPVPGSSWSAVFLEQPASAPYGQAACSGYGRSPEPVLRRLLESQPARVFGLIAWNESELLVQGRDGELRFSRDELRQLCLQPILPAKGSGMMRLCIETSSREEPPVHTEAVVWHVHTEALQTWSQEICQQLAGCLKLPWVMAPASHDC